VSKFFFYYILKTIAINGEIDLESFIDSLVRQVNAFENENELAEMKKLFTFIFDHFDEG